ncbi:hypothetical protein ACP70R_041381 [Stipagrostis hirtigluma subsp. patula]
MDASDRKDDEARASQSDERRRLSTAAINVALLLLIADCSVRTARLALDDPLDLAFLAVADADLTAVGWCLWRAECSPAGGGGRRRWRLAAWALSAALCCAVAFRVSLAAMPGVPAIVVWGIALCTALVVLYLLVVRKDREGYHVLDGDGDGDAGDGEGVVASR